MAGKYKYGELLVSNTDVTVELALSEEKVTIPKGSKVVIGFDGMAHHLRGGYIQPIESSAQIEGFSNDGIVETLYLYLFNQLPLRDMMEDYDVSPNDFKRVMVEALEELGCYSPAEESPEVSEEVQEV